MIHTKENFHNEVAIKLRATYFPSENPNYWKMIKALEDFNNGRLTYKILIGRLSKSCKTNNATIHNLVEKYIVSFGSYQYKPRKP